MSAYVPDRQRIFFTAPRLSHAASISGPGSVVVYEGAVRLLPRRTLEGCSAFATRMSHEDAYFLRILTRNSVLIFWTYFSTSVTFGTNSLVNNTGLLTKVYFPREILILAAIGASLVDLAVASTVFIGMLIIYHVPVTIVALWIFPLLLLQTLLAYGISLLGAALNVFYRDIRFVVPLGLQLWLYATPIMYPSEIVPERWRPILAFNPMVGIVQGYRDAILHGTALTWSTLGPGVLTTAVILVAGYWYFKRTEWSFADAI